MKNENKVQEKNPLYPLSETLLPGEADFLQSLLSKENIPAVVRKNKVNSIAGGQNCVVLVRKEDLADADYVLRRHFFHNSSE